METQTPGVFCHRESAEGVRGDLFEDGTPGGVSNFRYFQFTHKISFDWELEFGICL
jgi:hypothetical protein